MPCPRCGNPADPAAGPFCPHCGRYLATLQWVAEPPPSVTPPVPVPVPSRYTGPPRYRELPRGGFAPLPWRRPDEPAPPPAPSQLARSQAAVTIPLLLALVAVAVLASGAEVWRY